MNLARDHGFSLRRVHIESGKPLLEAYGERVPVLQLDGKELGWGRLSARALEREASRVKQSGGQGRVPPETEALENRSLEGARAAYFREAGLPADGGYEDRWVSLRFAGIPIVFPNTPGRVRAVRYHDLHHVLTGYGTDWSGEGEISAWEVASGCKGFAAAWVLNFFGMAVGFAVAPARTYRAFLRGRRSTNLYGEAYDEELLGRTVSEARRTNGLFESTDPPTAIDRVAFVAWALAAVSVGVLPFAGLGLGIRALLRALGAVF